MISAKAWKLKTRTLEFGNCPMIMGILNVTPDSFSDGGKYTTVKQAVIQAEKMVREGAAIIDVGGESTRPYSDSVALNEELERTIPVIEAIAKSVSLPISIDTSKAAVAREAILAGAEIINDVTGLEGDPGMIGVAKETSAGICAMHMQGTVKTMQDNPQYENVVDDILEYLQLRKKLLMDEGIDSQRICLDPGIGFGKTHEHNLELIRHCGRFHETACPILIGHSRKGFIGKILGDMEIERDSATAGLAAYMAQKKIQVIRVHNVGRTVGVLKGLESASGFDS